MWIVGVVLVLYVLSVGPVIKLVQKGVVSASAGVFYIPLFFLHDKTVVGKRFLEWYLEDVWKIK